MANYTAWSAVELTTELKWWKSRFDDPFARDKRKIETRLKKLTSELDRRCQIFSWAESDVIIRTSGPVYVQNDVYEGISGGAEQTIHFYGISNPADFSALLSYFTSKSRT